MADNILSNPWLQQGDLFAYPPEQVVLPAATWTLIAEPDPTRMTLTVVPGRYDDFLEVSPLAYGTDGVALPVVRTGVIQRHASLWPLLIGGSWWAFSTIGQTVTVINTVRRG